ncbi:hypothetical protein ACH5RR_002585 [Cinchona calisaya]|uniref:Uncharacterized protein n=1 Tax=Cinchona calisaya TaxID=153742 RepID=A0ABD3ASY6_9GENT
MAEELEEIWKKISLSNEGRARADVMGSDVQRGKDGKHVKILVEIDVSIPILQVTSPAAKKTTLRMFLSNLNLEIGSEEETSKRIELVGKEAQEITTSNIGEDPSKKDEELKGMKTKNHSRMLGRVGNKVSWRWMRPSEKKKKKVKPESEGG